MTIYFIQIEGGETRTVADWGVELKSLRRSKKEQAASTVQFSIPVRNLTDDCPFQAGDVITVWRGVEIDRNGRIVPDTGTRWFYGQVRFTKRHAVTGGHRWTVTAYDTWAWLEESRFKQSVYVWTRELDPETSKPLPNFHEFFTSDVLVPWKRVTVGAGVNIALLTTDQQIVEVLNWANSHIVPPIPLQVGTISLAPGGYSGGTVPMKQFLDANCSEIIKRMMYWSPDAIAWFDDETEPSTFHARRWQDLPEVTLALGPTVQAGKLIDGVIVEADIEPLDHMVVENVFFLFRKFNEVDGKTVPYFTIQAWPEGTTGNERAAVVDTFDLQGFTKVVQRSDVEVRPLNANHFLAATRVAWWKDLCTVLKDTRISDVQIIDVKFIAKDEEGNDVEIAQPYANQLIDGEITDWMEEKEGVEYREVEVRARAGFKRWKDDAHTQPVGGGDLITLGESSYVPVSVPGVIATNAVTKVYSTSEFTQQQEPEPLGLARWFFENASVRHFAGSIVITEPRIADRVKLGQRLNLTGGRPEWATMKALVTGIEDDVGTGTTQVTFGPPKYLGVHEMMEYLKINRVAGKRTVSAETAQTGQADAGTTITRSSVRARHNTTMGFAGGGGPNTWG